MTLWSGPEFISYLEFGLTAVGLIISLSKFLPDRKARAKLRIIKRYRILGQIDEEERIEIDLPLSPVVVEQINKHFEQRFKDKWD